MTASLSNKGENGANTSQRIPLEPQTQKINPLDWLFENFHVNKANFEPMWTSVRNMKVFKVSTHDPLQEVFRNASRVFYATTKLPHLQFVAQQTLIMEKSGFDMQIRGDANEN